MTTKTEKRDWQNNPVPEGETDETTILVWQIEPCITGDHDHRIVRSYTDACRLAADTLDALMDGSDEEDLHAGVSVKVQLRPMKLGDYRMLPDD